MPLPEDYWQSFEAEVDTLQRFLDSVQKISAFESATGARFVWRGTANATWQLYSSLALASQNRDGSILDEVEFQALEAKVLNEAQEWALDWHPGGGRLSALELLAALQHYGVPTRMLDFTFNPWIALWFAVEQKEEVPDDVDGRVFAIDISTRRIRRDQAARAEPWWFVDSGAIDPDEWARECWIWRPPPLEPRMVRQEGCFLVGGVPSTDVPRNVREAGAWRTLRKSEVRSCMSVPFRLISYQQAVAAFAGKKPPGRPPDARAFTIRIGNKVNVRRDLEQSFGYSHASLFPDFPGLAQYGRSWQSRF